MGEHRRPATLLHFSEDPTIEVFRPHIAGSRRDDPDAEPLVWADDLEHQPRYWFPRDCPRSTSWYVDETDPARAAAVLGTTTARRVHAIEWAWLERMGTTALYVYALPGETFEPNPGGGGWISRATVEPMSVEPVGNLLDRHAEAGIELRVGADLWAFHLAVVDSTLGFSGIRLSNSPSYRPA